MAGVAPAATGSFASGHYHFSAEGVGRGSGAPVMAKAAYRSGECLFDERTGQFHDYTGGAERVMDSFVMARDDAPAWIQHAAREARQRAWNEAERAEPRKNGRLATELVVGLPHELTDAQRKQLLKDYLAPIVARYGVFADVSIHTAHDERNIHAHILLSHRELGPDGFGEIANTRFENRKRKGEIVREKVAGIAATPSAIKGLREQWARDVNRAYEQAGLKIRVDHRSFVDRGIKELPTIHLGPGATKMERDGKYSDRGDINRIIQFGNAELRQLEAQKQRQDAEIIDFQAAVAGRGHDEIPPTKATEMDEQQPDAAVPVNQNDRGEAKPPDVGKNPDLENEAPDAANQNDRDKALFTASWDAPMTRDEAWKQPAFSGETLRADEQTAIYLPIPEQADEFLLHDASHAAFRSYENLGRALAEHTRGDRDLDTTDMREVDMGFDQRHKAAARVQELGARIETILLTYDPADPFREELILDADKARVVGAWQQGVFSAETIMADPWTAVYLGIPDTAPHQQLREAQDWARDLERYAENPRGAFGAPLITLPFEAPDHGAAAAARSAEFEARLNWRGQDGPWVAVEVDYAAAEILRPPEIAPEARTAPEPATAPIEPAQSTTPTTEPQRGAPAAFTPDPVREFEADAGAAIDKAERFASRLFAGIAHSVESVFHFFADMIAPEPKMTAQQVHDHLQAAGNLETLDAQSAAIAAAENEAVREWQAVNLKSADQETDLRLSQTLGVTATREGTLGREQDRPPDKDYERD